MGCAVGGTCAAACSLENCQETGTLGVVNLQIPVVGERTMAPLHLKLARRMSSNSMGP